MIELIKKYLDEGNMSNALMVGQNLFNKNKGDKKVFSCYFSLLLDAANSNYEQSDKFIEQLVTVLSIYSENAEITEQEVIYIRECETKLNKVVSNIKEKREAKRAEFLKEVILKNDSQLTTAKQLVDSLKKASSREYFNKILKDIYELDEKIDKNNFVCRQKIDYENITNECQKLVDLKLKQFDRLDNVEYNQKAVDSFEKIFNLFKDAKNASYKPKDIMELFSYDASRLTNETLIYYNHVYNYILSKLNDEEKLTMTKLSIIAEKKE